MSLTDLIASYFLFFYGFGIFLAGYAVLTLSDLIVDLLRGLLR